MKVDLSCPVEVCGYELPTLEQPYCSLVLFNLDEKVVRSVQVSLTLFDGEGQAVTRQWERALGLAAESKEYFEMNVPIEDGGWVQRVDPVVEKVWFDDVTIWRRSQAPDIEYETNALPVGRVLDHLRLIAGPDAVGFPAEQNGLWICVCGRPNGAAEQACRRCGRERQPMFAQMTPVAVQAWMEERDRQQQEQAKRVREETVREEEQRKAEARRRQRKRRNRLVGIFSTLVLAAAAYLFIVYGVPEIRFRQAEALLESGSAQQAKDVFLSLGGYRQANQRARDSDYRIAMDLVENPDAAKHEEGLRLLDEMTDYPQAQAQAQSTRYREAGIAMEQGEYERAEALLLKVEAVGAYEDAAQLLQDASYQIASQRMNSGEYEDAAKRFRALGEYRDAVTRAQTCVYFQAGVAMEAKDYSQAKALYASIPEYKDAVELARSCVYQYALQLKAEGKYDEAKAQFDMLGAYQDAAEQAKECVYVQAQARMQAGVYDEAVELFASIPDYDDAAELAKECVYLPAAAHYAAGEYQQAIALWETIPDYRDAGQQAQNAAYQQAIALQAEGKLIEAADAFDTLADYEDAAQRASGARYDAAAKEQEAGNFAQAQTMFAALGDFEDASQRADACGYSAAKALMDAGNWSEAKAAFVALGEYEDAGAQANLCDYRRAEKLRADNRLEEAAEVFSSLGKFEDAAAQANACRYELAEAYELSGEYARAGKAFEALGGYADAAQRAEKVYDTWLAGLQRSVDAAMSTANYVRVIQLIEEGVSLDALPPQYAGLQDDFERANLEYAKQLINAGNSLAAYPYLQRISGTREAQNLLEEYIYIILGAWDSPEGSHLEFHVDGSCVTDGLQGYFNVEGYGLMIGDAPLPQKRTHAIVLLDEQRLTLRREADGLTVKYSRTAAAEEPSAGEER